MNIIDWKTAVNGSPKRGSDQVMGTENVRDNESGAANRRYPFDEQPHPEPSLIAEGQEVRGLSRARLNEIRRRVEDGTYDSIEVAELVARQIMARGDL